MKQLLHSLDTRHTANSNLSVLSSTCETQLLRLISYIASRAYNSLPT